MPLVLGDPFVPSVAGEQLRLLLARWTAVKKPDDRVSLLFEAPHPAAQFLGPLLQASSNFLGKHLGRLACVTGVHGNAPSDEFHRPNGLLGVGTRQPDFPQEHFAREDGRIDTEALSGFGVAAGAVEFYNPGRAIGGRACPRTVQFVKDTVGTVFYDDKAQPGGSGVFLRTPIRTLNGR
ncbi:MAG: hypothetical protein FJ304_15555 [Planctomycetes bacterium]|nr:hypothetical protein [Planctomycetota bacterium]